MKLFPPTTVRHVSHLSLKPKKPDSVYKECNCIESDITVGILV